MVFASFTGFTSPLRHRATLSSCSWGGHEIWWEVTAVSAQAALDLLPHYVAQRTEATRVADVDIP